MVRALDKADAMLTQALYNIGSHLPFFTIYLFLIFAASCMLCRQ